MAPTIVMRWVVQYVVPMLVWLVHKWAPHELVKNAAPVRPRVEIQQVFTPVYVPKETVVERVVEVEVPAVTITEDKVVRRAAEQIVEQMETTQHTGSWRCAQARIALYRMFPAIPRRRLNLLLEQIVNGVKV